MNTTSPWGFLCFIVYTLIFFQQAEGARRVVCQGSRANIRCNNQRLLNIHSATYGRNDVQTCRTIAIISTTNCGIKDNVLSQVKNKCENKRRCNLRASNSVYKDPCPGTSVYLDVNYSCIRGCRPNQFQCKRNKKCIAKKRVCNGKKNCNDGSDEENCECKSNQFQCKKSKKCIPNNRVCDGKKNCQDGSDEQNCECSKTQFQCKTSKKCIAKSSVCDRKKDCNDGSDETGCPRGCSTTQFQCVTSKKCIAKSSVCDRKKDCNDGSDERGCPNVCSARQFQCVRSKKCIPKEFVCDRKNDCVDKSDEMNCVSPSPEKCGIPAIKPLLDPRECDFIRIVGGCPVDPPHSWPWTVQLLIDKNGNGTFRHECGAALISPSFALTAAHCFINSRNPERWRAIAGRHKKFGTEDNNQIKKISRIVSYPRTNGNILDQDVTIIKFATPVLLNNYVSTVCLPTREPNENDYCVVVGWGETQGTGNQDVLKQTKMPIVEKTRCNQTEEFKGEITQSMICGGFKEGKHDACQGDSGGPLMCRIGGTYYLQGLVSWGVDCAVAELPGVYANVFYFVSWIKQQMRVL